MLKRRPKLKKKDLLQKKQPRVKNLKMKLNKKRILKLN
jgi:hypothetical protein